MEMVIKVKGITRRWFINVLIVIIGVVVAVEVAFAFFFVSYFQNGVRDAAGGYAQHFVSSLNMVSGKDGFYTTAKEICEEFDYKSKVEIQVLDRNGNIVVTTSGLPAVAGKMPDYEIAKKSGNGIWKGQSSSGEKVMAGTVMLADYGNGPNGAVRWVVSMEKVNRHVAVVLSVTIAVGVGVILFATFSGFYFIKSIVKPIREVSNIARRIALGDFKARIDVQKNDEVGELCDSINYMASELSQAENMKNDFISSVSHELRTPLTAIRGWGETVKSSIGMDDQLVEKGVGVILSEADRLSGLVEELLDFSRMQSGRLSMQLKKTDILAELGEAVYMYEELARQQGLDLTFVSPEYLPPVMGDGDRLKQVFINIIDNAIKYTGTGGQVLVEAAEQEGCIQVTVKDTGVGIPAQDVDRVKEKFFKSNKTVRGSGIGLAVADEIVKQHKGLLFVESKEGVGTTVTIVLPIAPPAPAEQDEAPVDIPPTAVSFAGEAENEGKNEPTDVLTPDERNQEQ